LLEAEHMPLDGAAFGPTSFGSRIAAICSSAAGCDRAAIG